MKNKLSISIIAIGLLFLTSCSVTKATTRTIHANDTEIIIKPLLAEVEVDPTKKIKGNASARRMSVEEVKKLAMYDALEKSGADVIIDPIFKITTSGMLRITRIVTVEVTGFHGKYKNISTIEESELKNIELYTPDKKEKGGGVSMKIRKSKKNK
jgi:PBP1b-binding outer membrane lipoprotein LpoB